MPRILPWAVLGAILLGLPAAHGQTPKVAEQVHVTLGEGGRGLVVQFVLTGLPATPGDPATVLWSDGGPLKNVEARVAGTIEGETPAEQGSTIVYAATVDAAPGKTVTYRVGTPARGYAGPFEVTAPGERTALRFVALADIGSTGVGPDGGRLGTVASPPIDMRDLALAQKPGLVLIPGDLSYTNSRSGWDRFMRMYEPLQSRVATMPTIGNHEWHDDKPEYGYSRFLQHYVLPGNEQDFSFQAGPVTFVAVNSDAICAGDTYRTSYGHKAEPCPFGEPDLARRAWLEDALRAAQEDPLPWTVVYMHHPTYSWGRHGSDVGQQILWGPLFDRYGVDLVVTGHDHLYSRSHQIIAGEAQASGPIYPRGGGPLYVVTGGAGRPLYALPNETVSPRPAWHAFGASVFHLVVVDATEDRLNVRALNLDGSELDVFQIGPTGVPSTSAPPGDASHVSWLLAAAVLVVVAARFRR